ncbi:MAG: hypothetical protein ACK4UJ_06550 [Leptonema sp. (in: bacteria)]
MFLKDTRKLSKRKIFFLTFLGFVILFYQILMSPLFLNFWISNFLKNCENLDIQLNIKKSSVLSGFEIENIKIIDKISEEPIFLAKKFKLDYFLFGFFLGHIGIREISLEEPKIFLIEKNGKWNFESLIPKSEKQEEKKEEPVGDAIETFLPLKFYFYLNIKNLEFTYKKEQILNQKKIELEFLEIKDLSFYTGFVTKTLSKIPLNTEIGNIFEDFLFYINPKKNFFITYRKNEMISGTPILFIKFYKAAEENSKFISEIILNSNQLTFSKNNQTYSLITEFVWKIDYKSEQNEYLIQEISLKNNFGYLWNLKGKIKKLEDDYYLELEQQKEKNLNFSLEDYGKILNLLTENPIFLTGNLSFREFSFKGKLSELKGRILLGSDFLQYDKHRISNLNLNLEGIFNFKKTFSFLYDNDTENPNIEKNLAFGFIENLNLENLSFNYNNSLIRLKGVIDKAIFLDLNINQLDLGMFLEPDLKGSFNGNASMIANLDLTDIQFQVETSISNTQFSLDNYFSKPFTTFLKTKLHLQFVEESLSGANGKVSLNNSTNLEIQIQNFSLKKKNTNFSFLEIIGNTNLHFEKNLSRYSISVQNLLIDYNNLYEHIPNNLKETLYPYKNILEKGISLKGNSELTLGNKNFYFVDLNLLLPSLYQDPIKIKAKLQQSTSSLEIDQIAIQGLHNSLLVNLKGNLEKKSKWIPNLKLFFQYQNPQYLEIYKNLYLKGKTFLEVSINEKSINGNLHLQNLSTKYKLDCDKEDQNLCTYYEILNANLNLPFTFFLSQKTFVTYQSKEILSLPKPNFLIQGVLSNYSLDNLYFSKGFYLLGSKDKNAIEGVVEFKNNILWIPYMELFSYLDNRKNGEIILKNFYFNLSDLDLKNFELEGKFYLINFDLNSLFPKSEGMYKGIVSSLITIQAVNFSDPIRNMNVKLSIYQISKDFAGFIVRIIAPSLIAMTVNNTLSIKNINLELKSGLVYSNLRVQDRGFFSLSKLIKPESEEIREERIPLAEFLKRSQEEIKTTR